MIIKPDNDNNRASPMTLRGEIEWFVVLAMEEDDDELLRFLTERMSGQKESEGK